MLFLFTNGDGLIFFLLIAVIEMVVMEIVVRVILYLFFCGSEDILVKTVRMMLLLVAMRTLFLRVEAGMDILLVVVVRKVILVVALRLVVLATVLLLEAIAFGSNVVGRKNGDGESREVSVSNSLACARNSARGGYSDSNGNKCTGGSNCVGDGCFAVIRGVGGGLSGWLVLVVWRCSLWSCWYWKKQCYGGIGGERNGVGVVEAVVILVVVVI